MVEATYSRALSWFDEVAIVYPSEGMVIQYSKAQAGKPRTDGPGSRRVIRRVLHNQRVKIGAGARCPAFGNPRMTPCGVQNQRQVRN